MPRRRKANPANRSSPAPKSVGPERPGSAPKSPIAFKPIKRINLPEEVIACLFCIFCGVWMGLMLAFSPSFGKAIWVDFRGNPMILNKKIVKIYPLSIKARTLSGCSHGVELEDGTYFCITYPR